MTNADLIQIVKDKKREINENLKRQILQVNGGNKEEQENQIREF